jgi:phosphoribosylglycinamide formyltransferase-1
VIHIALFASGAGSNVRKITAYFENSDQVEVALILSNRKDAPVLQFAAEKGIPTLLLDRASFFHSTLLLERLREYRIDLLVLAGFLWLVPPYLVQAFHNRILNIHPALLPKFGGKGMYGHHVHEAVLAAGERESGITIHLVDEQYDHGSVLFQAACPVLPGDTPETLAKRVLSLEHLHYPIVIDQYIRNTFALPA